ncbi:Hsp20/alpha crystallin family protein [Haloarchaeobius sp. HRN-SO-5]|uniref:Hsp20/alpha crystallin family protein n=1 Tax=Haloarchaeobius sp. HRN-SO-5 TaxID=3446118 RepID=UPI003EBE6A28
MHDPEDTDDRIEDDDHSDANLAARLLLALAARGSRNVVEWLEAHDATVEYGSRVETGLGGRRPGARSANDGGTRRPTETTHHRTKRLYSSDYLTTTNREGDELVVSVDMPAVDPDDVTVGLSGSHLVVSVDGRPVERVPVDDPDPETVAATYRNGVLEVRVRLDGGVTDG